MIMDVAPPQPSMTRCGCGLLTRFTEIFVRCPLEIAIQRENRRAEGPATAEIKQKSLKLRETGAGFKGPGDVIVLDVPFEEYSLAYCMINSEYI